MAEDTRGDAAQPSGLRGALLRLGATLVGVLHTRIEIVSLEYEEEREWLRASLLLGAAALFLMGTGVLLVLAFVILAFPEPARTTVTGALAAGFILSGLLLGWYLRGRTRARPRMFDSTLRELAKDRDQLLGRR